MADARIFEEEKKPIRGMINLPAAYKNRPITILKSLDESKVALFSSWNRNGILIATLDQKENPPIELKHKDCAAFCVNKSKTEIITLSIDSINIWQLQENKEEPTQIEFIKQDDEPYSIDDVKKIELCEVDNKKYLIGIIEIKKNRIVEDVLTFDALIVIDLEDVKNRFILPTNAFDVIYDISLLQKESVTKLLVSMKSSGLIMYDLNFEAKDETIISNPTTLIDPKLDHEVWSFAVSPDGEYLACNDITHHGGMLYRIKDFTLKDPKPFTCKSSMIQLVSGSEPSSWTPPLHQLVFPDNDSLAFTALCKPGYGEVPDCNTYMISDLTTPVLSVEKCAGLEQGKTTRICIMKDGSLLEFANGFYTLTSKNIYKQALDALFQHRVSSSLPMFSSDVISLVLGYVDKSLTLHFSQNHRFFSKGSIDLSDRAFRISILEKLIGSKVSDHDKTTLNTFLVKTKNDNNPIIKRLMVVLEKIRLRAKRIQPSSELLKFLQELDKQSSLPAILKTGDQDRTITLSSQ